MYHHFPFFQEVKIKKTKNFHQNFHAAEGTDHDQVAKDTAGPGRFVGRELRLRNFVNETKFWTVFRGRSKISFLDFPYDCQSLRLIPIGTHTGSSPDMFPSLPPERQIFPF